MTTTEQLVITEPGVYEMTNEQYHADPVPDGSLSNSTAKLLLPPHCPALFRFYADNGGRPDKRSFNFGHAAHDRLLGGGPQIVVVNADSWRTDKAKAAAKEARDQGAVPILKHEDAIVDEMADAIRRHPVASRLLSPEYGTPEASLFWRDEPSGIMRRARLDTLPHTRNGRMIIPDYKSTAEGGAERDSFANTARKYGYHCQAPWYSDGVRALGLAEDVVFVFVVQEKTPPYLVNVVQLDAVAVRIGALLNRRAIDTYIECKANNHWPSYSEDVELVSLPVWYERQYEGEVA